MTSAYTTRKRLNKQGTGDNPNSWGTTLNSGALDVLDFALDGVTAKTVTGDWTATTANGSTSSNEAGARILKLAGSVAATATLPALEGWYIVINGTSATQTIATSGGGTSVTVLAGETVFVVCDATNMKRLTMLTQGSNRLQNVTDPTSNQDAATKKYVDDTAFNMAAGALPGQTANSGKFLTTDGTTASWAAPTPSSITGFSAAASAIWTGTTTAAAITPGGAYAAAALQTLTDATTIAIDLGLGLNWKVTLGGNRTLGNPTNAKEGQSGVIKVLQDGTGSRTLAYGSAWKFPGGAPTLTTTASAVDYIAYFVEDAATPILRCTLSRNFS